MHMENKEVASKLATLLSDVVTAKFILHGYHWNVMGPNFAEHHKFFKTLYKDVDSSIDPLGENILKLCFPAPYMMSDYLEMCSIKEERLDGTSPQAMLQSSLRIMQHLHDCHVELFKMSSECNLEGLADFLAGRIDIYATWLWQIKAFLGVR